jgi:hypothetical protein
MSGHAQHARGKQIPSTRKTLELEGTALGEFQARAGDEIGDHTRDQSFESDCAITRAAA